MTIPEEIVQLNIKLEQTVDEAAQGQVLLELLNKYASISSTETQPYIDHLLQLSKRLQQNHYKAWGDYYQAVLKKNMEEYDVSIGLFLHVISLFERLKDKNGIASSYNNMGIVYEKKGNYSEALANHFDSLKISEETENKAGMAGSYNNIGNIYKNQGDFPEALINHLASLKIAKEIGSKSLIANCYNSIGLVYELQGNFPEAMNNIFGALKIHEEIGDSYRCAASYNNVGNVYTHQGNYPEALKNYFSSLKIAEEIRNKSFMANSYNNIGLVYEKQGNYPETLKSYFTSLKLKEEIGDKQGMAYSHHNIGNIYGEQNNYDEALKNYAASISLSQEIGDKLCVASSHNGIGNVFALQGNYADALTNIFAALKIFREIGSKYNMARSYNILGSVYFSQGNYPKAVEQEFCAFRLAEEISAKDLMKESSISLVESYKALADFENAMKYLEKYHLVETEMLGEQAQKQLTNLSFIHNMEQTKKEMEIDRLKIVELNQQVSVTEMKALRSQMNPHFIFNSLQSIQNFMLQKNIDDANAYLLKFSKLMRMVLENSQYAEVNLKEDLKALELYMQLESLRLKLPFTYTITIDESIIEDEVQIPPLLLQPFVENSIWHGLQYKSESGHIHINIRNVDGTLVCTVEDNGVGRPLSKAPKAPAFLKKESLGMKLTEERLKILNQVKKANAYFKITDIFNSENKPKGTRVELSLPLAG